MTLALRASSPPLKPGLLKAASADADMSGEMSWATFYLPVLIVLGGGLLVGALFRWWGLLVPVGFAVFLMYAWEFYGPAVAYAVIAGGVASAGVVTGALLRRRLGGEALSDVSLRSAEGALRGRHRRR